MKTLLIITLLLCTGCASMGNFDNADKAWYVMHAIDVGQTLQTARNPECFEEVNFATRSFIGAHPSEEEVIMWGIGSALFYTAIKDHMPKWLKYANLGAQGLTISNNANIGLYPTHGECRK